MDALCIYLENISKELQIFSTAQSTIHNRTYEIGYSGGKDKQHHQR